MFDRESSDNETMLDSESREIFRSTITFKFAVLRR